MKQRLVALESRMAMLERFVEVLNNPLAQALADEARDLVDQGVLAALEEE